MNSTTAIQRAEQWRKENACGEAAKVAIALLNELQALQASRAIPEGHVVVPGWLPIESAPKNRSVMLYTKYGLTYCGRYRQGQLGEPSQHLVEWRCDSSGRYANPTHWMPLPVAPANKEGT